MVNSSRNLVGAALLLWAVGVGWNYETFSWQGVIELEYRARYVSLPRPQVVVHSSLGFSSSLADLYWIGASHYFGEPRYKGVNYSQLHEYIDIVNALSPRFHEPYFFGGAAIPWNTGTEWVNVPWAVEILGRGLEQFPDDWRLAFLEAYDLATYLGDFKAASRVMKVASASPESPPYLLELSARYATMTGDIDSAEAMTSEMAAAATDATTQEVMDQHLKELRAERDLQRMERADASYRTTHEGHHPPAVDDPDFVRALGTPFDQLRDPNGDPYAYEPDGGAFSSKNFARFIPHGLKKKPEP